MSTAATEAEPEIADAEIVPGHELERVSPGALFKTDDPVEIMERTAEVAGALKEFVKAQGLTSVISGRDYLLVEAWQMLGMMLGVTPGKVTSRPVEHGWESTVDLHDRSGRVVGSGSAECLDTEKTWKSRDDYARKSMAQTRAVGKAFRNTFGFIAKAAGYETTPAEEMPAGTSPLVAPFGPATSEKLLKQTHNAIAYMLGCPPGDNAVIAALARLTVLLEKPDGGGGFNSTPVYTPFAAAAAICAVATELKEQREAHEGDPAQETDEERAERILAEGGTDA